MMNVKETLKRLHRRLPTLSLDELFELLDCYVEQSYFNSFPTWEPNKVWYSTNKNTGVNETEKVTCVTNNTDSGIYTVNSNWTNGIAKLYDDGGSAQLTAHH